jgi:hypothetical protein
MVSNISSIFEPLPQKQAKKVEYFFYGFTIYSLTVVLTATQHVNFHICQGLQILGLLLMITSIFGGANLKIDNAYLRFIYVPYCLWLAYLVIQGFASKFDYTFLKDFLFNPYSGTLYFAPLFLLFPRNITFYKKLIDFICIFGIFFILYDVVFVRDLLNSDHNDAASQGIVETFSDLSFASGFILLTYAYHGRKKQLLALAVVLMQLLFVVYRARRGLLVMYSEILLFSYIFYISHSKLKLLVIYLTLFIGVVVAIYANNVYKPTDNKIFGYLLFRGDEDTRSDVEWYFHNDMKTNDWILGRGIKGSYFCPDVEEDQVTNYRYTIETGFEQTILKGGWISLGLFLLIAVPAVIKGLFYSKNILSKGAAIWIFMSLVNSYPSTVNAFTFQYVLVWVCIGICYNDEIRNIHEEDLKKQFLSQDNGNIES